MNKQNFVVGLDLGTSSAKLCAVDFSGHCLGLEREDYSSYNPEPGWSEQESADWLPALGKGMQRLLKNLNCGSEAVAGLAFSCASHIGVLLDKEFKPLRRVILWNDQRSFVEADQYSHSQGEEIFLKTSNWPTTTWTLPHMAWVAKHEPKVWDKVCYILLSKDYVAFQLTGERATDPATAVSSLLYDGHKQTWLSELMKPLNLSKHAFPEVLNFGDKIGSLTKQGAEAIGLVSGIPVFNGSLDSIAETLRAGVINEHGLVIRLASAGGIHAISAPARPHKKIISYPYAIEPYWLQQAGTNACASAVSWAVKNFQVADYQHWDQLAALSTTGAGGVFFHPYLAGERCPYWNAHLRASFTGLGVENNQGDMARAVYEGTAYSLRDALQVLMDNNPVLKESVKRISIVGGGAQSFIWCQILGNVLKIPVLPMLMADSSWGAALLALQGLSEQNPQNFIPSSEREQVILPDSASGDFYDLGFEKYQKIQQVLAQVYNG